MTLRAVIVSVFVAGMAIVLNGCFTGIESTPRITQKEVIRQNALSTDEDAFAAGLDLGPLYSWEPGKRLLVNDGRVALLMAGDFNILPGDTLVYTGVRQIPAVTGDSATLVCFNLPARYGPEEIAYRIDFPLSQVNERQRFEVPFTTDLDLVTKAREMFVGKSLYIMSPLWNDGKGNAISGQKFIPVTITGVVPGNSHYPLNVVFETDSGRRGAVMMTVGSDAGATRNFGEIFSFENPRLRYPSVTDEVWRHIISGDVMAGMTRDECRLALGTPRDVKKGENGAVFFERWTYDNGAYFIFEDGVLSSFRK